MHIVEYLLSLEETSVDAKNFYGETPVLCAVKTNNSEVLKKLIDIKADINIPNNENITPLHLSVTKHPDLTLLLLTNGAEIDAQDYGGDTPLNEAVRNGTFETVAMLLYFGADASIPCENNLSPFMFAIIRGHYEMQEQLIEYETDFDRTTEEDMSILFLAITHNSPFTIDIIRKGANINYNSLNLLTLVIDFGNIEVMKEIWSKINYEYIWGQRKPSLLTYALNSCSYDIFEHIIHSEKLLDVICHMETEKMAFLITRKIHEGYSSVRAIDAMYILLCSGIEMHEFEMEHIFMTLGDCPLYRLLLHMNIQHTNYSFSCLLHAILFHVNKTVEELIHLYLQNKFHNYIHMMNLRQILPFCTNAKLFHYMLTTCYKDNEKIKDPLMDIITHRKVPSLLEFSRNQLRKAICVKYSIKTSSQFYTVINHIDLPQMVKDIVSFKVPIYC